MNHALTPGRAGCRNQTHPCSLVFQNGERNRITPAVRLKGHSARLPSGLLALASVPFHVRHYKSIRQLPFLGIAGTIAASELERNTSRHVRMSGG
jgi:hypothetical protein